MSLRLVSLRSDREGGSVVAELNPTSGEDRVLAKFQVDQQGRISVANPVPDVFRQFAASIEEVRRITAAVIAFAEALRANEEQGSGL